MTKDIIELTMNLKDKIESSELVLSLRKCEELMNNDKDVQILQDLYKQAQVNLDNTSFKDETGLKNARKILSQAKFNLEIHPLVQDYLTIYQEVAKIYSLINNLVFSQFNFKKGCHVHAYNRG